MLYSNEVGADERNVINLSEGADNAAVVDTRDKDSKEISQQGRLLLEVEGEGFVVSNSVGVNTETMKGTAPAHISTLAARTMTSLN